MIKFVLDLDGTITSVETLPIIAKYFNVQEEIELLTAETIAGNVPFIESFIRRVHILGKLPVSEIDELLENTPLYEDLHRFITQNKEHCVIATGNLRCWTEKLIRKVGCDCYTSDGTVENNQVTKLTHILKKEDIVARYKSLGYKVVYIGEGNNDMEAMRMADISIAVGLTHKPANSVLTVADYVVYSEVALCRQLNQLF